ncbi:MAG: hypothetical protein NVSMB31_17680 [Vulcanimicrobiaceae bacterium]
MPAKNDPTHSFRARLEGYSQKGTMTFLRVPKRVMDVFAPRKRVPVRGTLNGTPFVTTITDMGDGPMIGVRKSLREAAKITQGDTVNVVVQHDTSTRDVTVPKDLTEAMSPAERARFEKFSFTHKREYIEAIESAKRPETRTRRIQKTLEMIRAKM